MNTSVINQKRVEEHIYASWPKEQNTWGNNEIINKKQYPPPPSSPPPPLPPPLPPPIVKRREKPTNKNLVLNKEYIEVDY